MTPAALKEYFDSNPLSKEINWKPWANIINTQKFLENAFLCMSNYEGKYEKCPEYWHLKELYDDIQAGRV